MKPINPRRVRVIVGTGALLAGLCITATIDKPQPAPVSTGDHPNHRATKANRDFSRQDALRHERASDWLNSAMDDSVAADPEAPGEFSEATDQAAAADSVLRSYTIQNSGLDFIPTARAGDRIVLPISNNESVACEVMEVFEDAGGWRRLSGEVAPPRIGEFTVSSNGGEVGGVITLADVKLAYEIVGRRDGGVDLLEKPLSSVRCDEYPMASMPAMPARIPNVESGDPATATIPLLNSKTSAKAVIYVDFDGETVTDPAWNKGKTINAEASGLSTAQIELIWRFLREDFSPFNVNVTTDPARYDSAPAGRRTRCIVTATRFPIPGYSAPPGGVAQLHSFSDGGGSKWSSTIPCWAFLRATHDDYAPFLAQNIAHEVGHTLGLSHDGLKNPFAEYYQPSYSGPLGWAPIMGNATTQPVGQWSKGAYPNANNQEDDIAIIAGSRNGFGFAKDEAGNDIKGAVPLKLSGAGVVGHNGVISRNTDFDFYVFTVSAGSIQITAKPEPNPSTDFDVTAASLPDLDIGLSLINEKGTILVNSKPSSTLQASISSKVPAGKYYLKVYGTGHGQFASGGYTSYGSIGQYHLTGSIPASAP